MLDTILQDIRYALRGLGHTPGVAGVAILTLALGIGAITAIFSFTTALMSARIPVRDIDRVAGVWSSDRSDSQPRILVSATDFIEWRRRQKSFESFAAQRFGAVNLSGIDQPVRVRVAFMTAEVLEVSGNRPVLGRGLRPEDNQPGATSVAILSHRFWRDRFEGREDVLGHDIRIKRGTTEWTRSCATSDMPHGRSCAARVLRQ